MCFQAIHSIFVCKCVSVCVCVTVFTFHFSYSMFKNLNSLFIVVVVFVIAIILGFHVVATVVANSKTLAIKFVLSDFATLNVAIC